MNSSASGASSQGKSFFLMAAFCSSLALGVLLLAQRLPVVGVLVIGHALAGLVVLATARARSGEAHARDRIIGDAVIGLAPAVFVLGVYHAASTWWCCRVW